jgi:hypothetical protein
VPERSKLDPDTAEAGTELYGHPIGRAARAWNARHGEWQLCCVPATILSKKALTMVVIEASKLWLLRMLAISGRATCLLDGSTRERSECS